MGKRILSFALALVMCLGLTACGEGAKPVDAAAAPQTQIVQNEKPQSTPSADDTLPPQQAEEPSDVSDMPDTPQADAPAAEPEAKPQAKSQAVVVDKTAKEPYYIKVNRAANTVTVYTKDESGGYTVPHMAMVCSTGLATPRKGAYKPVRRGEWHGLFDGVFGQYATRITGNILFHSVPYLKKFDPSSLEYWEFDKLGSAASLGCVRLQVKDAMWIYHNANDIAAVEFYSSDDPGPLGKPSAPLISDNELCRDWDPTDPNPENPWHSYLAELPPEDAEVPTEDVPASDVYAGEDDTTGDVPILEGEVSDAAEGETDDTQYAESSEAG